MAFRTWGRVLLTALCVGVLAGAGQLGVGYGLGILRFARTFDGAAVNQFPAHLAWLSWFTMVAAVAGAVVGERMAVRYGHHPGTAARIGLAGMAAIGSAAVAPLSMLPARAARLGSVDPVLIVGVSAALSAVVGLAAALAALSHRSVRWNIASIVCVIWFLTLISVLPSLGLTDPLPEVRLGVLDPPWLANGIAQRLAVVTMPGVALVAGAATGALTRWLEQPILIVATSGIAGPAMLAMAYLIAGPGASGDRYQAAPYWGGLIAAGAGALGSVLAATLRWPAVSGEGPTTTPDDTATPGGPSQMTEGATEGAGQRPGPGPDPKPDTGPPPDPKPDTGPPPPASPSAGTGIIGAPRPGTTAYGTPPAASALRYVPAPRRTPENDVYGSPPTRKPPAPEKPSVPRTDPTPPTTADFWPDAGVPATRPVPSGEAPAPFVPTDVHWDVSPPAASGSATNTPAATKRNVAEKKSPGGGRLRRALFRRDRSAEPGDGQPTGGVEVTDGDAPASLGQRERNRSEGPPLPAKDAEYVDWVSGLSAPPQAEKAAPEPGPPRRSLRSSGRHDSD